MDQNEQARNAERESRLVFKRFCLSYKNVPENVIEGLVAEGLTQWLEKLCLGDIEDPDHPRAYLAIAASHLIVEWRKRDRRTVSLDELQEEPGAEDSETSHFENVQDFEALLFAAGIGASDCELFRMRIFQDMQFEEISNVLEDHPRADVLRQHVHRMVVDLKKCAEAEQRRAAGGKRQAASGKRRKAKTAKSSPCAKNKKNKK